MKLMMRNINMITVYAAALLAVIIIFSSCENTSTDVSSYKYHTIDEVNDYLNTIRSACPEITEIEKVGTSVDGRPINALIVSGYSGNSTSPADLEMEPRVRLSGAIHGNEKITTEVLLMFIDYITSEYGSNAKITEMIDSRYIVIIPVVNPDGYVSSDRQNSNGVDLNRNFSREWASGSDHGSEPFSEPESIAVRDYSLPKKFTTSITMHTGAVIVNMPFDYGKESLGIYPVENDMVEFMGLTYSEAGTAPFYTNPDILISEYVYNGTINGGDWYIARGTMQDWSYLDSGCLDYTVEIAQHIYPVLHEDIEKAYTYNRDSLVEFINESGRGVYGQVTNSSSEPLSGVKISLPADEGDLIVYTDENGYYHRLLMPKAGSYSLTFELDGYGTDTESITLTESIPSQKLDIVLY